MRTLKGPAMGHAGRPLVIAAKQERGRESEKRLVDSLNRLLRAKPYEQISVPEIALGAGLAVGSVYRRFPGKERLLMFAARDLSSRTLLPALSRAEQRERWADLDGRDQIAKYLRFVARMFVAHRPLLRAVSIVGRLELDPELTALIRSANRSAHGRIRELLLARRADITHRDPEVAVDLGILWSSAALREVTLFGEPVSSLSTRARHAELAEELADGVWAYLTASRRSLR